MRTVATVGRKRVNGSRFCSPQRFERRLARRREARKSNGDDLRMVVDAGSMSTVTWDRAAPSSHRVYPVHLSILPKKSAANPVTRSEDFATNRGQDEPDLQRWILSWNLGYDELALVESGKQSSSLRVFEASRDQAW